MYSHDIVEASFSCERHSAEDIQRAFESNTNVQQQIRAGSNTPLPASYDILTASMARPRTRLNKKQLTSTWGKAKSQPMF